jgi:hypothetical protein
MRENDRRQHSRRDDVKNPMTSRTVRHPGRGGAASTPPYRCGESSLIAASRPLMTVSKPDFTREPGNLAVQAQHHAAGAQGPRAKT